MSTPKLSRYEILQVELDRLRKLAAQTAYVATYNEATQAIDRAIAICAGVIPSLRDIGSHPSQQATDVRSLTLAEGFTYANKVKTYW